MASHDALPDAILELVLLCLDSLPCLLRAAATCKRWRRIISSDAFRAIHKTPPLLIAGSYYNDETFARPRFVPLPSAAAAVNAAHFSLDFLHGDDDDDDRTNWSVKDSHGSLLLLVRESCGGGRTKRSDLIVCEPLTRRHEAIPLPLLAPPATYLGATTVFLDAGGGAAATGMSNFKVLCLVDEAYHIRAITFTSGSSSSAYSRRETSIDRRPALHYFGVAGGRRYWHDGNKRVLALDEMTLELSSFVLPDEEDWHPIFSVSMVSLTVGRDGEARVVVDGGDNDSLKIFVRIRSGGGGEEDWALEKTMQVSAEMLGLPEFRSFYLTWHQPVVEGTVQIRVPVAPDTARRLRLDMETMEAELLLEPDVVPVPDWMKAYPTEFPWPPLLYACCVEADDDN
ncbi:unnamed protein product [Urochloa decumbens]|uniref:F-box domain-containing protein n=1 Tax=Urochloa decumbens TaxID=240449 RepID=A0ABC9GAE2_9POAL